MYCDCVFISPCPDGVYVIIFSIRVDCCVIIDTLLNKRLCVIHAPCNK